MRFGKTISNKFDCFALNFHYICGKQRGAENWLRLYPPNLIRAMPAQGL